MNDIQYDQIQGRLTRELCLEAAFVGAIGVRALHARLHCGSKLFDGSKIDDSLDIAPCVVKWLCKTLVQLEKRGELLEEINQMERDFAATGLGRKGSSKPASMCRACEQSFCPIWKSLNAT